MRLEVLACSFCFFAFWRNVIDTQQAAVKRGLPINKKPLPINLNSIRGERGWQVCRCTGLRYDGLLIDSLRGQWSEAKRKEIHQELGWFVCGWKCRFGMQQVVVVWFNSTIQAWTLFLSEFQVKRDRECERQRQGLWTKTKLTEIENMFLSKSHWHSELEREDRKKKRSV